MSGGLDLNTISGCLSFILDRRYACRKMICVLDKLYAINRSERRAASKLRETENPIFIRRAEIIESDVKLRSDSMQEARYSLIRFGQDVMTAADFIDAVVPQSLLLDVLNVNHVERGQVSPGDGIVSIAYIQGLEDSAMYRGADWKHGPLAQAITRFMSNELIHNEALNKSANEYLFGKGGMFEFLPTYKQSSNGSMIRQPPKLRLADECDAA